MRLVAAGWLAVALLAAAGGLVAPGVQAQALVWVNVTETENLGCSSDGDIFTGSPDLRVLVTVDGTVVLSTSEGWGDPAMHAEAVQIAAPGRRVVVTIEIQEGGWGGLFSSKPDYRQCDASSGSGAVHEFFWSGEDRTIVAKGNGADAAKTTVVFGGGAPSAPDVQVSATATTADLVWDAGPAGGTHRVLQAPYRSLQDGQDVDGQEAGRAHLAGLCENEEYRVQVIRGLDAWQVGTWVKFRTENEDPRAPVIGSADASGGNLTVQVLAEGSDLRRLEFHVGHEETFWPDATSFRAATTSVFPSSDLPPQLSPARRVFAANETSGFVKVVAVDSGGLIAVSEPFQVGGPHVELGNPIVCVAGAPTPSADGAPTGLTPTRLAIGFGVSAVIVGVGVFLLLVLGGGPRRRRRLR